MKASTGVRLDTLLVERGWVENLPKAHALILSGRVRWRGQTVTHVGLRVKDPIQLQVIPPRPYVSRGGEKLAGALKALSLSVQGKVCLDIGSSTGGFTDCLLQAGAQRVWALDVGHRQLDLQLRTNPRVRVQEGVNFRFFDPQTLSERPHFITADVSFISLGKILTKIWETLRPRGEALVLVKPQFEGSPKEAPQGLVKDEGIRQDILSRVRQMAQKAGFQVQGMVDSPMRGRKGNRETFFYLQKR